MVSTGRGAEAEEEPRALQIRQLGKLAKQRVFGLPAPQARTYFGVPMGVPRATKPCCCGGPVATPDLGPLFCDSGRRRATFVVENTRFAQVGGYAGMCLDLSCH